MDMLPSELVTIISSYIKDVIGMDEFEHLFQSKIDWINLIVLNYPRFYHVNLKHYHTKYIYFDLLSYNNDYWDTYISLNKNVFKYMYLNNLINDDLSIIKVNVMRFDDIEIYDKFIYKNNYDLGSSNLIRYNSVNILTYILSKNKEPTYAYKILDEILNDITFDSHDNGKIKLDNIKLVTNFINFKLLDDITILKIIRYGDQNKEIIDYVFNLFSSNIKIKNIETFKDRLLLKIYNYFISFYHFKQFYDEYNFMFDYEYLLKLKDLLSEENLNLHTVPKYKEYYEQHRKFISKLLDE